MPFSNALGFVMCIMARCIHFRCHCERSGVYTCIHLGICSEARVVSQLIDSTDCEVLAPDVRVDLSV